MNFIRIASSAPGFLAGLAAGVNAMAKIKGALGTLPDRVTFGVTISLPRRHQPSVVVPTCGIREAEPRRHFGPDHLALSEHGAVGHSS